MYRIEVLVYIPCARAQGEESRKSRASSFFAPYLCFVFVSLNSLGEVMSDCADCEGDNVAKALSGRPGGGGGMTKEGGKDGGGGIEGGGGGVTSEVRIIKL